MIEQYLRSKSSQKTWLWAPQLCASSKPFLNCNFLFYPTHSNIKLRNPFRDYVIWHHYFTGGSIETCHCNKARIRTQAKPRPINYFTGLISPQIMWLASSFKSFPTQTILLPQSINPHCHIFLSLCQEITFSILQALDNWLLYFHFQRVTSIFLDWCSSLSYSHFLWQKFKKKKSRRDKGHFFLNCIPQSSQANSQEFIGHLFLIWCIQSLQLREPHFQTETFCLRAHSGSILVPGGPIKAWIQLQDTLTYILAPSVSSD